MNILEVKNLTKEFNGFTAVNSISFKVKEGEIFGFLGPNGAGKTTTINMLAGLARITSGTVRLSGFTYPEQITRAKGLIGVVPDESNLYDELSGFDNLCFCAALYGMGKEERQKRARELLIKFGLDDTGKKPFKTYSKGMKRKLTIAAGIIHGPGILFLDEPTTGIDVASARQIRKLIQELNSNNTTIFLTTHYIEEAERLCQRIAFIVDGKIVRMGTVEELMKEVQNEVIVQFTLSRPAPGIRDSLEEQFPGFTIETADNHVVRAHSPDRINLMPFMSFFEQNNLAVHEAKIIHPSLEEVFVRVTGIEIDKLKKEKEGRKK